METALEAAIFYGLIGVVIFSAIPYGTVDPWSQAVFEGAIFFLGLLWIFHGLLHGSWETGSLRLVLPIIFLIGFAILQSLTWSAPEQAGTAVLRSLSADPSESWAFALRVGALALASVVFTRFTNSVRRLNLLVHAVIVLAIGCALFGLAREALQHGDGFLLSRLKQSAGYAQFINKDHFSYLMEIAFGLIVGVALVRSGRPERIPLYLAGLIVIWAALVLSKSRGGLLAMSMQMIFAAFLLVNGRIKTRASVDSRFKPTWVQRALANSLIIAILLITIVLGVAWLGGDQLVTGAETAAVEIAGADTSELHEAARRRDIWRASWRMFKQHPITGAGFGGFWAEVPAFHDGSGVLTPQQAHNDYLEVLASGGLIGAAILIWFGAALVIQTRHILRRVEGFQRAVCLGTIIALAGVAVHSLVDFGLHITVNALIVMILLAILSLEPFAETVKTRRIKNATS
jgi:O-antigen ligase